MCYDDVLMYQSFGYGKMCLLGVDDTEVDMIRSILDRWFLICALWLKSNPHSSFAWAKYEISIVNCKLDLYHYSDTK